MSLSLNAAEVLQPHSGSSGQGRESQEQGKGSTLRQGRQTFTPTPPFPARALAQLPKTPKRSFEEQSDERGAEMGPPSRQLEPGLLIRNNWPLPHPHRMCSKLSLTFVCQPEPAGAAALPSTPDSGLNPGLEVCRAAGVHPQLAVVSWEHQQFHKARSAWKNHFSLVGKHQEREAVLHRGDICTQVQ